MSCRWTVERPMRRTWNWRLQSGEDVRRNKSRVKVKQLNITFTSSPPSPPLFSSWCFPADASGQASAETDREVEVHQQSDQNPAQVRRPLTRTETDRLPWLLQCSVSNHICLCFFSLLPETLLHCLNCVHLLALHRQLLADTLLMDRPTMQNAGDTHTHTHFTVHYIYINIYNECVCFRTDQQSISFHLPCAVGPTGPAGRSQGILFSPHVVHDFYQQRYTFDF